jgi:hypothetical protein
MEQTTAGPAYYEIRIAGRLDPQWADWFSGLTITYADGITVLAGLVPDQAALHGHLALVRDLALTLISVRCCPPRAP